MADDLIAHVRRGIEGAWEGPHLLEDHLEQTGKLAEVFATKFQSGTWGKVAGLAHDVGKSREE